MENAEIVITTLNGFPRTCDSFIQGICARKKLVNFSKLWEECSQEEAWIAAQEEKMESEYQAFMVHSKSTKRRYHHSRGKYYHKDNTRKYLSRIICYTCDESGHYARNGPKKQNKKRSNKRRHHAHDVEDDEPSKKRTRYECEILQARMNMF